MPIKFRLMAGSFVDYPYTNDKQVTRIGTWFHVYAKTCIQENIKCRHGTGKGDSAEDCSGTQDWKKTVVEGRNGKIILEIRIDI